MLSNKFDLNTHCPKACHECHAQSAQDTMSVTRSSSIEPMFYNVISSSMITIFYPCVSNIIVSLLLFLLARPGATKLFNYDSNNDHSHALKLTCAPTGDIF